MSDRPVDLYEKGVITGHQCALESLLELDPADPGRVLERLPAAVLEQVVETIQAYKPGRRILTTHGPAPTEEQVAAAKRWIRETERAGRN